MFPTFIRPDSTDQSSRKKIARERTFPKCGVTIQSDSLQQYFLHVTIWNYLFFTIVKMKFGIVVEFDFGHEFNSL